MKKTKIPHVQLDHVQTQKQAAEVLNVPIEAIRLCKRLGCPGFNVKNKVFLKPIQAFMTTRNFKAAWSELSDRMAWKDRHEKARALIAEEKLKNLRAQYWEADNVQALIAAGDKAMQDTLETFLKGQSRRVSEKSAAQVLKINQAEITALVESMRDARETAMEKAAAGMQEVTK